MKRKREITEAPPLLTHKRQSRKFSVIRTYTTTYVDSNSSPNNNNNNTTSPVSGSSATTSKGAPISATTISPSSPSSKQEQQPKKREKKTTKRKKVLPQSPVREVVTLLIDPQLLRETLLNHDVLRIIFSYVDSTLITDQSCFLVCHSWMLFSRHFLLNHQSLYLNRTNISSLKKFQKCIRNLIESNESNTGESDASRRRSNRRGSTTRRSFSAASRLPVENLSLSFLDRTAMDQLMRSRFDCLFDFSNLKSIQLLGVDSKNCQLIFKWIIDNFNSLSTDNEDDDDDDDDEDDDNDEDGDSDGDYVDRRKSKHMVRSLETLCLRECDVRHSVVAKLFGSPLDFSFSVIQQRVNQFLNDECALNLTSYKTKTIQVRRVSEFLYHKKNSVCSLVVSNADRGASFRIELEKVNLDNDKCVSDVSKVHLDSLTVPFASVKSKKEIIVPSSLKSSSTITADESAASQKDLAVPQFLFMKQLRSIKVGCLSLKLMFLMAAPQLEILDIKSQPQVTSTVDLILPKVRQFSLEIASSPSITLRNLERVQSLSIDCRECHDFRLSLCSSPMFANVQFVKSLKSVFQSVRILIFNKVEHLEDLNLSDCFNLESLIISECPNFTRLSCIHSRKLVQVVIQSCPKLLEARFFVERTNLTQYVVRGVNDRCSVSFNART